MGERVDCNRRCHQTGRVRDLLPTTMAIALTPLLAYLLGSIPFGYLIVRWQKGVDVRRTGSGGTGATNVARNLGLVGFVATFILDAGKGAIAVLLASRLTAGDPRGIAFASVAAILGHCFPVWLNFHGGKGVATGVGVFLALAPVQVGLVLVLFAVIVAIWRYVSLGSIIATAAFPLLVYFMKHAPPPIVFGAAGSAVIIISMHHGNIGRLIAGTESKVGQKKSGVRSPESGVSGP
jgi:acyl phosphate:glycerol-3-phosphate acyltransferase